MDVSVDGCELWGTVSCEEIGELKSASLRSALGRPNSALVGIIQPVVNSPPVLVGHLAIGCILILKSMVRQEDHYNRPLARKRATCVTIG